MKINLGQIVKKFDGHPLVDEKEQVITFMTFMDNVLNSQEAGKPLTAEQKVRAFQIGTKIYGSKKKGECDLTTEQIAFLKERMAIFASPLVYGRFCELIGDLKVDPPEGE